MQDSALLDVIQLIYPGDTTANHTMDGGSFDKTIRAHLPHDAIIYQQIIKFAFTDKELDDMRIFIEKLINEGVRNN